MRQAPGVFPTGNPSRGSRDHRIVLSACGCEGVKKAEFQLDVISLELLSGNETHLLCLGSQGDFECAAGISTSRQKTLRGPPCG